MHTFNATVLVGGAFVQTQVVAQTVYHANLLLQAQYGANSVAIYPRQVD